MNSANNLTINHPDDLDSPVTPVSNMPFDESIEFRTSDCISTEATEKSNELEECIKFKREDINAYDEVFNKLPPIPPTKEEEKDDEENVKNIIDNNKVYEREFNVFKDKLGDGKMEYIKDKNTRELCIDAWRAITITNNWGFISKEIDSFMLSNDPEIDEITKKMNKLNDHSGTSFGYTMRYMQFLAQNGEEKFKKCFELDDLEKNC